jgi:tRNA dimethylallyltransferase
MPHPENPASIKQQVVAVVGPTATGKTRLGITLAEYLQSEVISADSRVIYRELNIGTAKPDAAETRGIPHHMVDVADPLEEFSAVRYRDMAKPILDRILAEGKVPVVVGGTGFYLRALLEASHFPEVPPNEAFRKQMAALAGEKGAQLLHGLLQEKDPVRAAALHPNDQFRVIRALEIIESTGKPVSQGEMEMPYHVTWFGLYCENRDFLRDRIDRRIEAMLDAGWLDEVRTLVKQYGTDAKALQVAHGYPELAAYLEGRLSWDEALNQMRINIHQYARRQMTWFRAERFQQYDMHWFALDEVPFKEIEDRCKAILATRLATWGTKNCK